MSDICEKCSPESTKCSCKKEFPYVHPQFFYMGKYFDSEQEFWKHIKNFRNRETTQQDFDFLFDRLKKDLWINLQIRNFKIYNYNWTGILEDAFCFFIEKLFMKKEHEEYFMKKEKKS